MIVFETMKKLILSNYLLMIRVRSGKTIVADTNSMTSRGLLTQKKPIPGRKKIWLSSGQKITI
jgi:hypothetical protein